MIHILVNTTDAQGGGVVSVYSGLPRQIALLCRVGEGALG